MTSKDIIKKLCELRKETGGEYACRALESRLSHLTPKKGELLPLIAEEVTVGENSGGNCWGGSASYRSLDYVEPDLARQVIEAVAPGASVLQYFQLKDRVRTHDFSRSEYYGNYTDHRVYYIMFDAVVEVLDDSA